MGTTLRPGEVFMDMYASYYKEGGVVLKRWIIVNGNPNPVLDENYHFGGTLADCRAEMLRMGYVTLESEPSDDPSIIETYL